MEPGWNLFIRGSINLTQKVAITIVRTSAIKQVIDKLEKYIISMKVFDNRCTPLKTFIIAV